MDCRNCPNKSCYINNNCSSSWLQFIEKEKIRKYFSSDATIFSAGDLATGIYVICSGGVKVMIGEKNKAGKIIRFAGKGQVLGHRGLSSEMAYPISAVTISNSELAFIPNEVFFKLLKENSDLNFYMLMFFANELARSERKYGLLTKLADDTKVAIALCLFIEAFGFNPNKKKKIDCKIDLKDISNFAEVEISSVKNILNRFADRKIISLGESEIEILNEDELRLNADFNH